MNPLTTLPAWLVALLAPLLLLCIGCLIWAILPKRTATARRNADIDRQIATLRKGADHSVATRPRVRAGGYQPAGSVGPVNAPPRAPDKPCGGGLCRKRIDCADNYCPGKYEARIATVNPPAAPGVRILKY